MKTFMIQTCVVLRHVAASADQPRYNTSSARNASEVENFHETLLQQHYHWLNQILQCFQHVRRRSIEILFHAEGLQRHSKSSLSDSGPTHLEHNAVDMGWWLMGHTKHNTSQVAVHESSLLCCYSLVVFRSLVKHKALTSEKMAIVATVLVKIKGSLFWPTTFLQHLFAPDAPAEPLVECISSPFAKKPPTLLRVGLPWTIRYSSPCLVYITLSHAQTKKLQDLAREAVASCRNH